jgi:hypothetical protein
MKTYRIYYHRIENAPQVWAVDEGTTATEIHVQGFTLIGGIVRGRVAANPEEGQPGGWLEVADMELELSGGCAVFSRRPSRSLTEKDVYVSTECFPIPATRADLPWKKVERWP